MDLKVSATARKRIKRQYRFGAAAMHPERSSDLANSDNSFGYTSWPGVISPRTTRMDMQLPKQISLEPPETEVELRAYGFGMMPFDGRPPASADACVAMLPPQGVGEITLQISAASLAMSNELIRDFVLGPEMMDVARFQELAFRGTGWGKEVVGALSMHGETHRLAMGYTRSAGTVTVTGRLRREDWGIKGAPMIGGSIIRIRVALPDPFRERLS